MKYKKHNPAHKKLLSLFNDLLDISFTSKKTVSESQENKNEIENEKVESRKEKNENENENAKNKITNNNTTKDENENGDEDKNTLLKYIDVDVQLFKKYNHGKDFNSFIN